MSHLVPGPMKPLKQQPLLLLGSPQVKVFLLLTGLLMYVYMLFFVKSIYLKVQRLDRVGVMTLKTEHMIHNVHTVDQNMAINMERMDNGLADY